VKISFKKVHRICAEVTKMVRRICKLRVHNCPFLVQNSDKPTVCVHSYENTDVFTTLATIKSHVMFCVTDI